MTRNRVLVAVVAWCVLTFVAMSVAAASHDTFPGDRTVMHHAQRVGWFEPIARFFNVAVDDRIIPIGAGVLVGVAVLARQWPFALAFTVSWTAPVLTMLVKRWVGRPRPEGDFDIHFFPSTDSFPSGHAFNGALFATLLAFAALRWAPQPYATLAVIGCVVFAGMAGFARFWLGVHWFSDAVGSWLLAFACGATAWLIAERIDGWRLRGQHDSHSGGTATAAEER